jgi:hypothetical protein
MTASLDQVARLNRASMDPSNPLAYLPWPSTGSLESDPGWDVDLPTPLGAVIPERRCRGLLAKSLACHLMATGIAFERELQAGLCDHLARLDPGSAEYEYIHHEMIEESRHSQMFGRFLSLLPDVPRDDGLVSATLAAIDLSEAARNHPELLFLAALAGEEPIDRLQRLLIRSNELPELLHQISRTHVREEARHMAYARWALRTKLPTVGPKRRRRLELLAPSLLLDTGWLMIVPPPAVLEANKVVLTEHNVDLLVGLTHEITSGLWGFCDQLGIVTRTAERLREQWRPKSAFHTR